MIYITYKQDSGGRSGHKLGEIFTCFILSCMLDVKILYNPTWEKQLIISKESFKKHSDNFNGNFDRIEKISNVRKWKSILWEDFVNLKKKISNINDENVLIELSNVYKIYPHIIYNWYLNKNLEEDIYHYKVLPKLRELYFYDHKENQINCITIHIRCGDLHNWMTKAGFTLDYYKKIVQVLNSNFNNKIKIFFENKNHQEFVELKKLKNVEVYIGGVNDFDKHFNDMINSKVLIVSSSNMCVFATYLCKGLVLVDNKCHTRDELYGTYDKGIIEFFDNISEKIDLIKSVLE